MAYRKTVHVQAHKRHRPFTRMPPLVPVEAHMRHWPGFGELFIPGEVGEVLLPSEIGAVDMTCLPFKYQDLEGKICYWEKDDKMYGSLKVESYGLNLLVAASVPLDVIRKVVMGQIVELGWSPWKAIKKAGKSIAKTVAKTARKHIAKKLTKIVQHPMFQKLAYKALPAGLSVLGIPPYLTTKALNLVNQGKKKNPVALDKIRNIANLKNQGYQPAEKLWGAMSSYYRGGMPAIQQLPPRMPQYPQYPPAPRYPQYPPAPQYPQYPQYPSMTPGMPGMMPGMMPSMMPRMPYGLQRFQFPGFSGEVGISGWIYNIPYRSNVAALSLDTKNPFHIARALYKAGSQ